MSFGESPSEMEDMKGWIYIGLASLTIGVTMIGIIGGMISLLWDKVKNRIANKNKKEDNLKERPN